MTESKNQPGNEPKRPGSAGRRDRLREALRENLKRRKVQARGRDAAPRRDGSGAPHDSAGIVPEVVPNTPKR